MQLQEIIKYKPKSGKLYRVESVTVAFRSVSLAKHVAKAYPTQVATSLLMYSMGCLFMTNKKKLEALKETMNNVKADFKRYKERFQKS